MLRRMFVQYIGSITARQLQSLYTRLSEPMFQNYRNLVLALALSATVGAAATAVNIENQRRLSFNEGWRFFKGDAPGAEAPKFADSQWTQLRLPHDWAIEGPFDPKANPHTGALPISGTGWYRKSFTLPAAAHGRYFSIEFDGAMANSTVWINGHQLGGRPYGYIGFGFDLTPYLKFGPDVNVLAVRLTPEDRSSRWYPGAGIYRNVWLDVTGPVRVARWGAYVTTPRVAAERATVDVRIELLNQSDTPVSVTLQAAILNRARWEVRTHSEQVTLQAHASGAEDFSLAIDSPQLWELDNPYLYTLAATVLDSRNRAIDRYDTPFGIRSIVFNKDVGVLLNGRRVRLQGVCDHHDLGALGATVNRRATERQLEILKAGGVNAIRTSHNPPSPELLEYCDRMGLLVIDEAFDMWRIPKVPNGYSKYFAEWSERDVRDMVHRDRNHPSIIMWSIGNEIPEQSRPEGGSEARRLTGFFHEEDPTRPTTSAFNNSDAAIRNGLADAVDIPGFNYKPTQYERYHKEHPEWIIYGSETASCVSSRGVYHLPIQKYEKHPSLQLSSYDIIAPPWAYCPDAEFAAQEKLPSLLGEFVWTGFDYIGEPTPYFNGSGDHPEDWPARSSYFGMIDLAGFPKDRYYLYQSVWSKKPMVHVLPHWNWQPGQTIPVMAYSNGDAVELFLNGKPLGRKKRFGDPVEIPVGPNISGDRKFVSKYRLMWQVPFEPGVLKAVAYQNGKQVAVDEMHTAGAPAKVRLIPDRATLHADGDDLSFVTVRIEDKDGNLCPVAENLVHFAVAGAGSIAAVDNGNAATVEPFHADSRKAFSGLALLIVRANSHPGQIHVSATSDGLANASVELSSR
jgi:beta-galactosidase